MAIAKNPKVIMNEKQFVERLMVLANRKTYYKNRYPDNLCYVHADGRTSADCVNLVKAILNGYDVNNTMPGYYQRDLSNTGDCTEAELLCQCTDISDDFSNMGNHPRILWMNKPNGHIGVYLGKELTISGNVYNVIECTASWGGGILYSYVDSDGTRRKNRNGVVNCKWLKNGLPSRWGCNASESSNSDENNKVDYSNHPILKRGNRGKYVTILQELLVAKGYDPKGVDGIFGPGCQSAVCKFQKENTDIYNRRLDVDGCVGPLTWGSLYK